MPCAGPTGPNVSRPSGDVDCDGTVNSIDAALVLQFDRGFIDSLPCPENADVDEDDTLTSIDAALILQLDAGLMDRPSS